MSNLLERYRELTLAQKMALLDGDWERAIELLDQKEQLVLGMVGQQQPVAKSNPLTEQSLLQDILQLNQEVGDLMKQQRDRLFQQWVDVQKEKQMQLAYLNQSTQPATDLGSLWSTVSYSKYMDERK